MPRPARCRRVVRNRHRIVAHEPLPRSDARSTLAGALERLLSDQALAARLGARGHEELAGTGDDAARLVSETMDRCVTAGGER